ncbi:MAG: Asp-tRNA(Asn)/Glu-tRNA(Gln) amidotransferase subunit GatC [bacterium]
MSLTKQDVQQIAKLARLDLTEEETELYQQQLSSILQYVEMLGEVDTSGVEPTSQVTGLQNITRADKVHTSLSNEQALKNAPSREDRFFKVKPVIE